MELQRASGADANASWYAWGHPPPQVKAEQELQTSELETSVPGTGILNPSDSASSQAVLPDAEVSHRVWPKRE